MRDEEGRSKGFGFVSYVEPDIADKVVLGLRGQHVHGKPLYVAVAERKEERRAKMASQYMQRLAEMRMNVSSRLLDTLDRTSLAVRRSRTDVCADGWWRIRGTGHDTAQCGDAADGNGAAANGNDAATNENGTTADEDGATADGNDAAANVACDTASMVAYDDAQHAA